MDKRTMIKRLKLLKEKEIYLKKFCSGPFSSKEEGEKYIKDNQEMFNEFKQIRKEIKKIEWELMTDDEKKNHLKYLQDLKNKFTDENP